MINLLLALALTQDVPTDTFERLHSIVRPAEKEAPWSEVPWMTSLWQARQKAAEQGKPILLWEMDGHPLACT